MISDWLYPYIGFDLANHARDSKGSWSGQWSIDVVGTVKPVNVYTALRELCCFKYFDHFLQLAIRQNFISSSEETSQHSIAEIRMLIDSYTEDTSPRLLLSLVHKLETEPETLKQSLTISGGVPNGRHLLENGPGELINLATQIWRALAGIGVRCVLTGSTAVFLQIPFRLSFDLDFVIPNIVDVKKFEQIERSLESVGAKILIRKPSYIMVQFPHYFNLTVDIEIGSAYRIPISAMPEIKIWDSAKYDLEIMEAGYIVSLKKVILRTKDFVDVHWADRYL